MRPYALGPMQTKLVLLHDLNNKMQLLYTLSLHVIVGWRSLQLFWLFSEKLGVTSVLNGGDY